VPVGPGVFALAGLLALGIAVTTVSYHALRAATTNPVSTLRTE
jgi:putative ABC transport system permease protein